MISTFRILVVTAAVLTSAYASPLLAQQKGQYVPGQYGLNAGAIPDPGITYANITINYSAGQLNNSNGNAVPGITGTYSFWVNENLFYYVPKHKFLGGYFFPYVVLAAANGSLVADLVGTNLSANGGGEGFADMYVQPVNLGWHLKHADVAAGYGFTAPTGRFTPGASNNVGSGYWGNDFTTNTTVYLTKNKATTASLATIWEIHGQKDGTNITPGQAFTDEWGFGQILPLKKDFSRLLQLGVIGYDQWQVTDNGGTTHGFPYYSSHAVGFQSNFIMPAKNLLFFFKFEDEYSAKARPEGREFVFGFSWTLRIPKPEPPKGPAPAPVSPAKP
jgi:hypothetical protein